MYIFLILAIISALLEAYATDRGLQKLEFVAKPAVIVCLLIWLYLTAGLKGTAFWLGLGLLFALAGDVLLLWLDRFFLYGLIAFLFTHIFYIIGFKAEFATVSFWSLLLMFILGVSGVRLMRRIIPSMRANGETRLIIPVIIYAIVITIMLLAAMLTLSDVTWKAGASLLVAAGAFSFYISDLILGWNKLVKPIARGRLINIALYHAGQIVLVAGVIAQAG
jgi:uncharacterized membrane protein YhhN